MPIDSDYVPPLFTGTVYRSRVNDIINMSDSDAIGSFSIAELNTQYNNVVDLDEIQSRTFDADSDGIVRGFTDFSNTINTMDENHWLQIDSDGYGNNMLGNQLDFAPEYPGRPQGPIYSIGISNLRAQPSTIVGAAARLLTGNGNLVSGNSIVEGEAQRFITAVGILLSTNSVVDGLSERKITEDSAILEAQASTVVATTKRTVNGIDATPEAQPATVDGLSERTITGFGTLQAQVSIVEGTDAILGSGILEAQVSTVDGTGVVRPAIQGSGTLLAQPSTVDGAGDTLQPYVGMPFPEKYVGMPFPEIYVDGVIQPE